MAFIDKLESLRINRGVSKNKFCADISVNKNAIANWENRKNVPDGEVLAKIAAYFNVTVDYLVDSEKPASDGEQPELTEQQILANQLIEKIRVMDSADLMALDALIDRLAQK